MPDFANTILLVHPSEVDPTPFLCRLVGRDVDKEQVLVPWTIDNKYYTAQVTFQLTDLNHHGSIPAGVEVIVYLFSDIPTTLPPGLVKNLVDEPKDVALAIRIIDKKFLEDHEWSESALRTAEDAWEEMFEEVGFEVVDETAKPEDDDERPIDPLETIRQTLMTHLWPGMVRKPKVSARTDHLPAARDIVLTDDVDDFEAGTSAFPISFSGNNQTPTHGQRADGDSFPGLAELRAQIEMDDFGRFERSGDLFGESSAMGRLGMLEDLLDGPGEEEYARLDGWLDDDDDTDGYGDFVQLVPDAEDNAEADSPNLSGDPAPGHTVAPQVDPNFDDDFDDFAAFQSAPEVMQTQGLTMDPTPLLLHLQSVRAELAGLGEEERRTRAGKEVARVMRDLGFDNVDATDLLGEDGEPIE